MATIDINLKFGEPILNSSQLSFQVQLRREFIESHYHDMSTKIGKYNLPVAVIQMPHNAKITSFPLPIQQIFNQDDFTSQNYESNGKYFRLFNPKAHEAIGIMQKLQKIFKSLTQLQNKLYLQVILHDVDSFQQKIKQKIVDFFTVLLDNSSIQGKVDLDGRFIQTVGLVISKISPGFSQSPIMAFLELFSSLEVELEFDSPAILNQKTRNLLTRQLLEVQLPDDDEEGKEINNLMSIKEPTSIYIHCKKLGFIRIEFQTRMLAFLHCLAP